MLTSAPARMSRLPFSSTFLALLAAGSSGLAQDPASTEGTRALPPAEALGAFRVREGLRVELVAAEPLIQDPVAIDWGPDARLWVCEMGDYPSGLDGQWQPGGRVKALSDTDGDGIYDRAVVFLEGLPFPTGILVWGRGVLICAAPDILHAEDTDGDGRADRVEKLFSGFATENYQARVNSLSLGLDNWIHGANGLLGGVIRRASTNFFPRPAPQEPVDLRGRDFRFHPGTGAFETASGLTQQGRVRDDWGHWFGNDNSNPLFQYPWEERHLRRNPHVRAPDAVRVVPVGEDPGRLYPASEPRARFNDPEAANRFTSACGLGLHRDSEILPELYDQAFVCDPVHNLVHREVIAFDGLLASSRRAPEEERSEFLASSDPWFRPVQVRTGPDGALYVVDMYRFLIEHPRWIPAERLARLDVRAGADRGRVYRLRPVGGSLRGVRDLTRLDAVEVAAALNSANGTERDRVHVELLHRGDAAGVPILVGLATGSPEAGVLRGGGRGEAGPWSPPGAATRLQAMSVLDGLGQLGQEVLGRPELTRDPRLGTFHFRLLESRLSDANHPDALAALSLALRPVATVEERIQQALALGASPVPEAGGHLARMASRELTHPTLRAAILSSALIHAPRILDLLALLPPDRPGRDDWLPPLAATLAATHAPEEVARLLASMVPDVGAPLGESLLAALAELAERLPPGVVEPRPGAEPARPAPTEGSLNEPRAVDASVVLQFPRRWQRVLDAARGQAGAMTGSPTARVAALRIVGRHGGKPADLDLLGRVAVEDPDPALRRVALQGLRRHPGVDLAPRLLARWPKATPAARSGLAAFLLETDAGTRTLLEAIRAGQIQPTELALADRNRLVAAAHPELRRLLPSQEERTGLLERYRAALELPGRPDQGRQVFEAQCASCHRLDGIGFEVGPDLVALRAKDAAYWLRNILDPNAAIEPRFVAYEVELRDDRLVSGLIRGETPTHLEVVGGNGVATTVTHADIRQLRASRVSLMPEGFESAIGVQAMADLLAYLRPVAPPRLTPGPIAWKASPDGVLRDARTVAGFILDPTQPEVQRENAVRNNPQFAGALIAEFTRDLVPGTPEEYVRIPWIWRVAIACGRRNEAGQILAVLDVSLPRTNAPLHDWQAVALGGGIINGMSQREPWPGQRLAAMLAGTPELRARWQRSLDLAATMAEDARVPEGTRYDALRLLGVDSFEKRGAQLLRHLAAGTPAELQMGAVSGLADVPDPAAAVALADALVHLTGRNRELALEALLRDEARAGILLDAVAAKRITPGTLDAAHGETLRRHASPRLRRRAHELLPPPAP